MARESVLNASRLADHGLVHPECLLLIAHQTCRDGSACPRRQQDQTDALRLISISRLANSSFTDLAHTLRVKQLIHLYNPLWAVSARFDRFVDVAALLLSQILSQSSPVFCCGEPAIDSDSHHAAGRATWVRFSPCHLVKPSDIWPGILLGRSLATAQLAAGSTSISSR